MKNEKQKKNFFVCRSGLCKKAFGFASLFPSEGLLQLHEPQHSSKKKKKRSRHPSHSRRQFTTRPVKGQLKKKEENRKRIYSRKKETNWENCWGHDASVGYGSKRDAPEVDEVNVLLPPLCP
jgi:hypothetical protein